MSLPVSLPDPLLGRVIAGKFEIQSLLGGGGMGKVYKARHRALDKLIAVKVLHQHYQSDAKFAQRFQREALSASKLDHPNGIQVLDFGQEPDGLLYIAMEFLAGKDLYQILVEQGVPTLERTVEIMSQVCAALQAAHDQGIVHRDMKPENVVIVPRVGDDGLTVEHVKVCDFGIAKVQDSRAYDDAQQAAPLTTAGMVCGTPEFMSPEQARGLKLDARSDIYSCGVILFQMATGVMPFTGDGAIGIVMKQVMEAPPLPSSLNPAVTPALEALILRALDKDPAKRPQSARELRAELRALVASGAESGRVTAAPVATPPLGQASLGVGSAATIQAPATPPELPSPPATGTGLSTGPTLQAPVTPTPSPVVATPITDRGAPSSLIVHAHVSSTGPGIEVLRAPSAGRRGSARLVGGAITFLVIAAVAGWLLTRRDGGVPRETANAPPSPTASRALQRTVEAPPPPVALEPPASTAPVEPVVLAREPTPTDDEPAPIAKTVRRTPRVTPEHAPAAPAPAAWPALEPSAAPEVIPEPAPAQHAPSLAPVAAPRPAPVPAPSPPPGPLLARAVVSIARWDGSSPRSTGAIAANRLVGALEGCYATAARREGRNARGALTVSLSIDENGRATGVRVAGDLLPGLGACVRDTIRRLAAARPDTGTVDASFRIEFTPRGR